MRYLLDTHTAMWALMGEKSKLSKKAMTITDNLSISLYASVVSVWEIAIKTSIGKSNFEGGSIAFVEKLKESGVGVLDLKPQHIAHIEKLPLLHRAPFDRMLISITIAESMTIVSADENIHKYDVMWIW